MLLIFRDLCKRNVKTEHNKNQTQHPFIQITRNIVIKLCFKELLVIRYYLLICKQDLLGLQYNGSLLHHDDCPTAPSLLPTADFSVSSYLKKKGFEPQHYHYYLLEERNINNQLSMVIIIINQNHIASTIDLLYYYKANIIVKTNKRSVGNLFPIKFWNIYI